VADVDVLHEVLRSKIHALDRGSRRAVLGRLKEGPRPRLLDLFCGAGGAGRGYQMAGFDVTGVDAVHQRHYPGRFHKGDAMEVSLDGFDVVHASPPCQAYSRTTNIRAGSADAHPRLLEAVRARLEAWGGPYVIENVEGAPMRKERTVMLCGRMFGLLTYRHRMFESNVFLMSQPHKAHRKKVARKLEEIEADPEAILSAVGNFAAVDRHAKALGIDWRMTRAEMAEAIPPAYTRYLGLQLANYLFQSR
jgi:DNA (cytosine-5)-methyltransferase 1